MIVGRTYLIPSAPGTAGISVVSTWPVTQQQPPAPSGENWYTVKEGDSLWKIATEQCGSAGAITAIKELNKESLKGGETVIINQKLRLPTKAQIASNRPA